MITYVKNNNGLIQAFNPRIPVYQSYSWVQGLSPAGEIYIIEGDGLYFENIKLISSSSGPKPMVGELKYYWGNTSPNSDWLVCDGSTFDTTVYPKLALILGGNTLPDYRQATLQGDNNDAGTFYKASIKSHLHSATVNHTHTVSISNHSHIVAVPATETGSTAAGGWLGQSASRTTLENTYSGTTNEANVNVTIDNKSRPGVTGPVMNTTITRSEQIGVNILIRGK